MLRLDSQAAMLKGGESEESAVVPGKPGESAVRYESNEMPPKGKVLRKTLLFWSSGSSLGLPGPATTVS